ncbi:glutamate racemase [Marinimicrobium sp. ARAG 43.8]|uniref:glutamate racemase n=1 Tax=Marinimicrobium sp. ARAG 43.8 TaxID=3418719 RepID=UPI003CEB9124
MTSVRPGASRPPQLLVFDSGVGGLSVAAEIQRALPGCAIAYASDNAAFPYGTKDEATLVDRVGRVLASLVNAVQPDVIVVACNSASTLALPHIRARFAAPIVGVVPAIKPAAALTRSRVIGLLATPGTVARPYTHELITQFAADCTVISLGSSALVEEAEARLRGTPVDPARLDELLRPLRDHPRYGEMDTLVLACTHFPLLRDDLQQWVGSAVQLVDSGEAIARRVEYWLSQLALPRENTRPEHLALFTRDDPEVARLAPALQRFGFEQLRILPV